MTNLSPASFRSWMEAYGRASERDDPDASAALFAPEASYQESPFAEPIVGREAIRRYWEDGARRLADKRSEFEIVAVSGDTGIARWRSTFTVVESGERVALDCVFVVELGDDGTCTRFREWWHATRTPAAPPPA